MRRSATLWLAVVTVGWLLCGGRGLELADLRCYDLFLSARPRQPLDERIQLVVVDADSQEKYGRWPFPRDLHAQLIERLQQAGASQIAFDVSFAHDTPQDGVLAEAMRASGQVWLVRTYERDAEGNLKADRLAQPLVEAAAGVASPRVVRDADHKVRRVSLVDDPPPLAREVVEAFTGQSYLPAVPALASQARLGQQSLPTFGPRNLMLLDFASDITANLNSYAWVLAAPADELRRRFNGRIVLVGSGTDFNDYLLLPVAIKTHPENGGLEGNRGGVAGFVVHALAIDTLLDPAPLRWQPMLLDLRRRHDVWAGGFTVGAILCALLVLADGAWSGRRSGRRALALAVVYPLLTAGLFLTAGVFWFTALPVLMVGAYGMLSAGLDSVRVRGLLKSFMPAEHIEAMLATPERLQEQQRLQEVTVMFVDLRDFTTLSEKVDAATLRAVVSDFHDVVGRVCQAHGGYITDFQGDAQMMVFGLGETSAQHARCGLQAALELEPGIQELNARLDPEVAATHGPLGWGAGLASGQVSVGYLRGGGHLQYTVLGDACNTAARLQGVARDLGTLIVVSHTTAESASGFDLRQRGQVPLKGKAEAHRIFTLH
ncbi:MAG: adenylate/guanylate cyclase domain-containing protein [Candidatus Eremiobacteraeota bacterium]|nr:adenylate/guanylate cyclase domain-containing protein [Candidatus Eremiobacteraeota bacterium]